MALSERERFDRLRLARTDRIGPVAFEHLLRSCGSAAAALDALPELSRRGGALCTPAPAAEVEAELAAGDRYGARLLALGDGDYPARLAALDPPPPVVWVRGDVALLARDSIAVVGARIASAAGQRFARQFAGDLGREGLVVVSGLARGIDTAAHEGSLATGTVAVLGGGVDDIYPAENAGLHARLCAEGCVVSESRMGARAQARDFPRRNRIISGLSRGVVVVEAELRSGSLITARLAGEQGRDVFAVPGSPLDPRARGCNELIRQGAVLCEGVDDVMRALSGLRTLAEPPGRYDDLDRNALDRDDAELRERVAALLSPTPVPRDELARITGAPAGAVMGALMELSLAGRAELLPGGTVASA